MNFRINAQKHIIEDIKTCMENSHMGYAIQRSWDIEYDVQKHSTTIIFTLKPGAEINPADLFWFGFFSGRD